MQIYVINLARRPDRLAKMEAQLSALGLPFTRIDAVDGTGDAEIGYPRNHPRLSKPEYACYLSHINTFRAFLETGASHCLVLEDDVELSARLPAFLAETPFLTSDRALVRLEAPNMVHWGHPALCMPRPVKAHGGFRLFRLLSVGHGTGAYIIPRPLAARIVAQFSEPRRHIDLFLFQKWIPGKPNFPTWQCQPPLARQWSFRDMSKPRDSDIMAARKAHMRAAGSAPALLDIARTFGRNITTNLRRLVYRLGRVSGLFTQKFPFDE